MKLPKPFWSAICTALFALGISATANAALVDRGGGLIYDDVLDITWLANADLSSSVGRTWTQALGDAASFSYFDTVRAVTWDDWRLPTADVNGDGTVEFFCATSSEAACQDNEFGYMFYYNLGGASGFPASAGSNVANYNLFSNIQDARYWYSDEANASEGRDFNFGNGSVAAANKLQGYLVWAVRDGDVVPIPGAVWLFGSGLLGLIGIAKRKKA